MATGDRGRQGFGGAVAGGDRLGLERPDHRGAEHAAGDALARPTHFTGNLLTAPGKVHSRGYLGRSQDWGELVFGGDAARRRPVTTDPGTALTSLAVRKVATPPAVDGTLTGWQGIPFVDFSILPGYVGGRFAGGLAAAYDSASLYIAMRMQFAAAAAQSDAGAFAGRFPRR